MRMLEIVLASFTIAYPLGEGAYPHCQTEPVIMYMTTWCPFCQDLRKFFVKNNVGFVEVDAERSGPAAMNIARTSGIPTSRVEGGWVVGADKERFRALLCIN